MGVIPLSPKLALLLCEWRKLTARQSSEDFIFPGRDGRPKDHKRIMRDHIKPACTNLDLPNVSAKQRGERMGNSAEVNSTTRKCWITLYGRQSSVC